MVKFIGDNYYHLYKNNSKIIYKINIILQRFYIYELILTLDSEMNDECIDFRMMYGLNFFFVCHNFLGSIKIL